MYIPDYLRLVTLKWLLIINLHPAVGEMVFYSNKTNVDLRIAFDSNTGSGVNLFLSIFIKALVILPITLSSIFLNVR